MSDGISLHWTNAPNTFNHTEDIMFEEVLCEDSGGSKNKRHPKCEGQKYWTDCGYEYDCGYNTELSCEDCKYGMGRKDPEAKCNQSN